MPRGRGDVEKALACQPDLGSYGLARRVEPCKHEKSWKVQVPRQSSLSCSVTRTHPCARLFLSRAVWPQAAAGPRLCGPHRQWEGTKPG